MKKHFLYLTAIAVVLTTTFAACDKGDPQKETTVEEDKANIQASFDRVKVLLQNFRNGNAYHFTEDFFGIGTKEERDYIWVGEGNGAYIQGEPYTVYDAVMPEFTKLLGEEFGKIMEAKVGEVEEESRFKMATFAGKYTWNNTNKKWDITPKNDIQVVFPAAENGAPCELGITEYTDQAYNIEGNTVYLPTKISSYFNKDGVKIAGVEATGDYNQYGIPKNATANIYAKPITLQASLTQASASKYSAALSIADETNDENSLAISGEATLSNAINNYTDVSDCEINHVKFTLTQHALSIVGSIDLKTLNNINDPSITEINACLNLEVFYDSQKTGTLKVKEVGNDVHLYIVYKDGTEENTEIYYDSFVTDIESIFLNK